MQPNIINQLGPLAVGARIRRFYDTLAKDMTRVYTENGLPLEPKDFILYYLLSQRDKLSISDIAKELSLTHPAVIHVAKSLEKMGYVESVKDEEDTRKRYLKLTKKGRQDVVKYQPLWQNVRLLNNALFVQHTQFLKTLETLEGLLEQQSFYQRFHAIQPTKNNTAPKRQKAAKK